MASIIIYVRSTATKPNAKVKIRVKVNSFQNNETISAHALLGVEVAKKAWSTTKKAIASTYETAYSSEKKHISNIKDRINTSLNAVFPNDGSEPTAELSSKWLKAVIQGYWDELKAAEVAEAKEIALQKESEEAERQRETLNRFIDRYISEIERGERLTDKQLRYSNGTIKSIRTSMVQFKEYQVASKRELDFNDIDLTTYKAYTAWLTTAKGYKPNSVGKCVKDLKSVLNKAKDDGLHANTQYQNKSFKVITTEVDNIYLTQNELDAMEALDLSDKATGYELARDVFLLGCCVAQRVSDYTTIKASDISTHTLMETTSDGETLTTQYSQVRITQQKGGNKVVVILNPMAKRILAKYNNEIPYIWAQNLNENIKFVGRWSGITEVVQCDYIKGGEKISEGVEKCELITSHTARRTGATLMYLSGMDVYDICRITGHTNIKMLRKYIKADELDAAAKMQKYDYFK
ncbi:MAG: phage integrase SAM-like domain-containing protein [Rikenellaceae bacterium]